MPGSQPGVEEAPGLRKLATHRPNHTQAVLTYDVATLQRTGNAGANIDIYV